MNAAGINPFLKQMEAMKVQAANQEPKINAGTNIAENAVGKADFASILQNSIEQVNELQQTSHNMADAFVRGETDDLVGVMISQQKARVASTAMIEVRNKLLESYREVMNMSV